MNIHEYQAKALLKGYGAPVAEGVAIFSAEEAEAAAKPQAAPQPQATPKPAEAAAQPVPVKAQVINEPMQAPSHSGIQRRPEKPSLLARVLAKFIR